MHSWCPVYGEVSPWALERNVMKMHKRNLDHAMNHVDVARETPLGTEFE